MCILTTAIISVLDSSGVMVVTDADDDVVNTFVSLDSCSGEVDVVISSFVVDVVALLSDIVVDDLITSAFVISGFITSCVDWTGVFVVIVWADVEQLCCFSVWINNVSIVFM